MYVLINAYFFFLQIQLCFPEEGQVYDYRLDDAGIGTFEEDDEEEEREVKRWCFNIQIMN